MKALILSCGGSPEPLIYCINNLSSDFVYFLCSEKSQVDAHNIIKDTNYPSDKYAFKTVSNHESLEDSFVKSREIIRELQKDYDDITVDFTGGTKPMIAGLVLAAIGEECNYSYVGSKSSQGRDKNGLGIVQDGFEEIKKQRNPYDIFAVLEFEKGMEFFNKHQFNAAKTNFSEASKKLESKNLKELSEIYIEIVELYDLWDKFNNLNDENRSLNSALDRILKKINASKNVKNNFLNEYPDFIPQIEDNIEFLKLKISRRGVIKFKNVKYYLPDLLNNAARRIEESKYDDAVARLYRAIELIAQIKLCEENLIDESTLRSHAEFKINKSNIIKLGNGNVNKLVEEFNEYDNADKTFGLALKNSYRLLDSLNLEFATKYLDDDELANNVSRRNSSILAHGLKPINEKKANELYLQVYEYAADVFPEIDKYMKMSKFPKFIK